MNDVNAFFFFRKRIEYTLQLHSYNANKYVVRGAREGDSMFESNRGENYITFNMTHSILFAQY